MTEAAFPARRPNFFLQIAKALLLLVVFCILLALGTWQVQRLHWKEGLLADIAERQATAPVPLSVIETMVASGGDIEYRVVTATGHYLNDKERHFFATYDGDPGYHVYTPLQLADGRYLFVNRGFVPDVDKAPEKRMQGQLTGEQTVIGLARAKLAEHPSGMPDNDLAKDIFYWKDLDAMASSDGLPKDKVLPFFVDAGKAPNPGGLPIGGVTIVDLPNSHLQYAVTWYGLAAALVVIVAISWWRKRHPEAPQQ
ncbi:MAG TPA: SURF1 family protein [Rhizobium sp.]